MNWQEYKTYHKNKYGTSSQQLLSNDYQAYKTRQLGSPSRLRSPSRQYEPIDYDNVLTTMPTSRVYKTRQLERVSHNRYQGQGSPTRGWNALAPQRGRERHELKNKCGAKAFLDPQHEKYPIMGSLRSNEGCHVSCQGVQSAYNRACQYKHFDIAHKANKMGETKCGWSPRKTCGSPVRSPIRSPPRLRY